MSTRTAGGRNISVIRMVPRGGGLEAEARVPAGRGTADALRAWLEEVESERLSAGVDAGGRVDALNGLSVLEERRRGVLEEE